MLRGENPVTSRSQTDGIARLQRPTSGRIDLDEGLALTSTQRDYGALCRPKGPNMADRSVIRRFGDSDVDQFRRANLGAKRPQVNETEFRYSPAMALF